ncbi:hypothetical protein [Eubacterium limosum]|nr:hypothetical protein [Eubacterium limosum]
MKKYTSDYEEVEKLLREGYKVDSMSYWMYNKGPLCFILSK